MVTDVTPLVQMGAHLVVCGKMANVTHVKEALWERIVTDLVLKIVKATALNIQVHALTSANLATMVGLVVTNVLLPANHMGVILKPVIAKMVARRDIMVTNVNSIVLVIVWASSVTKEVARAPVDVRKVSMDLFVIKFAPKPAVQMRVTKRPETVQLGVIMATMETIAPLCVLQGA